MTQEEGSKEFFDVIEKRRSIRAYDSKPIAPDAIDAILNAARLAPSAGDLQAYAVACVQNSQTKSALVAAAHGQDFIAAAPIVLVFLADASRSAHKYGVRGAQLFCIQDATIAAAHAQLAATALGLGSCWVGAFDEDAVARLLQAPAGLRPIVIMPLGHSAEAPARTPRRPLADLVHREHV